MSNNLESIPLKLATITDPIVSIVIPTFKRARYLADAIDSSLNQDDNSISYEIIVINNDPNETMDSIISKYMHNEKISFYVNKENYGQVSNINQGIKLSRGKFISLLHDDDVLLPNYLKAISAFINNPSHDCLITPNYLLKEKYSFGLKYQLFNWLYFVRYFYRKKLTTVTLKKNARALSNIYGVPTCGMLFNKKCLEEFGYFKDEHGAAWDYYNFRLFNKKYTMAILNQFVAIRRLHTGMSNLTAVQKDFYQEKLYAIEENKNMFIVRTLGKSLADRRPILKMMFATFISKTYIFTHNLVTTKPISKKVLRSFIDRGYKI